MSDEVRTVSSTGGAKGVKPAQVGALYAPALLQIAEVAGFGSAKYARYNYLLGYEWSKSFDAMMRHALAFWSGEDLDPESGMPHMAHVGWHAQALLAFMALHPDFDDRFTSCVATVKKDRAPFAALLEVLTDNFNATLNEITHPEPCDGSPTCKCRSRL